MPCCGQSRVSKSKETFKSDKLQGFFFSIIFYVPSFYPGILMIICYNIYSHGYFSPTGKPPYVFPEFDDSHKYFARATNAFGELMYEYVNMSATYQEASDFCSLAGGSLFTARNAYNFISLDIRLLRRVVHIEEFWLGASDRIKEGNFRFEDGSPVLWNFFRMNEGKNDKSIFGFFRRRKRDCVLMNMLGVGYVRKCDERHSFVCQYWGQPKETGR